MNAPTTPEADVQIVPPTDFPVTWPRPEFEAYHWTRDREHMPDPITPMFLTVARYTALQAREDATRDYANAIATRYDIPINTYLYTCIIPYTGTPEDVEARARRNRQKVERVALRLEDYWKQTWRPELEDHWNFWAAFDVAGADVVALAEHLEESLARTARLYAVHHMMGPPMWFAIDEFVTYYRDLFPEQSDLDAHRLLQGFDNKTLEIGRALWQLRDQAKAEPWVCRALTGLPVEEVWAALEDFAEGRIFLEALTDFLKRYGGRSNLWDWGYPSWEDDPTPVLLNLRNYLAQPDRDLRAELTLAAAKREVAVARARAALTGYPRPVVERFEVLLKAAQVAVVLTENHTYYIDFNGFGWFHRLVRGVGERFVAQGRLDCASDAFYLTLDELREMLADETCTARSQAAERRAEVEHWAQYDEPRELGSPPAEPLYLYSPDARRELRYVGGRVGGAPQPAAEGNVIQGQAGSAGKVRGVARVIRSLAEAHRLGPGEILVTTTTAPPWTPLFLTAAAVVTDTGGLLSHGAVVSREYGIPAVVGTQVATERIADGQMIEVDGDQGVVRLL